MSSFRDHRVIIASLFLPTTAALSTDSSESSSEISYVPEEPSSAPLLSPMPASPGLAASKTRISHTPLKSIVDDLTVKSKPITPSITPRAEALNPFATHFKTLGSALSSITDRDNVRLSPPPRSRSKGTQHHTLHQRDTPARLLSRRSSRSASLLRSSRSETPAPTWHLEPNPQGNGGLYNAVASVSGSLLKRKLWVGTLGTATDGFDAHVRKGVDARLRDECDSVNVWIDDNEFAGYYDVFCHQVLWPCLHYAIPDAPKTKVFYESGSYTQYVACNQKFADAIIQNYQEGDIVWVNDYHLMLVPSLVRAALPSAAIGFFLHVAFPSSEIFRCLAVREKLLHGLLAADLIGFQTANFARHFRQTVSRILSLETVPKGITTREGKFVDVAVFPMGIDVSSLNIKRKDPEVAEWVQLLKQRYVDMKIIVGRDKLDEVQGVRHKLLAFETFLSRFPQFHGEVVLIQVALSTTEENELQGGVADLVSRINSRFSTLTYQPVVFLHTQDLTFSQYLALLTVADAFIVTSLREGMALRTHEYVECQEGRARPLILSEFTGSYSYAGFRSCIAINPWDARTTAEAIYQALTMNDEEALSRWKDLHRHVVTQTAQAFVTSFLTRCVRVNLEHQQRDPCAIPPLDIDALLPRYKYSSVRLILLDLEGTLWVRAHPQHAFEPPAEAVAILRKLGEDPRNRVWLLSGLPRCELNKVARVVPSIGLVAENGCFIKPRPIRGKEQQWINMVTNCNMTWKTPCLEILGYFTERTPGSFVAGQEASIVWRFWTEENESRGDRQWARRQASEAQNHIWDSLGERYGLRIIPGRNSFLVIPGNISRSSAVGAILRPGGPSEAIPTSWFTPEVTAPDDTVQDVDIVICIGADEKLLSRLNELDNAETCTTSGKGSDGKWRLNVEEVIPTLWKFANLTNA
ncbi:glycosyltransferase family 20-domain-containing protein [Gautieria morchelliformis]|nr:glycosyltransferase family 20-domain-containing protein [Gautieria morchelliformis]